LELKGEFYDKSELKSIKRAKKEPKKSQKRAKKEPAKRGGGCIFASASIGLEALWVALYFACPNLGCQHG